MKNRFFLLIFLLAMVNILQGFSQSTPSSCLPPWTLQQAYNHDVMNMAVLHMKEIQDPDTIYVNIPPSKQIPIMEGLAAIFNSGLPARDSVFDMYCVHDLVDNVVCPGYMIGVSPVASWTASWQNLVTMTGIATLDSLLVKYDLHITSWLSALNVGVFSTSQLLNPYALADSLKGACADLLYVEPDLMVGLAGKIEYHEGDVVRLYKFQFEWNDCFDGCDNWHAWEFSVLPDCSVEYLGFSQGGYFGIEPLPAPLNCNITTGVSPGQVIMPNLTVFPNPAQNLLYVDFPGNSGETAICEGYNMAGELCFRQEAPAGTRLSLNISSWSNGVYFLKTQIAGKSYSSRFVVSEH